MKLEVLNQVGKDESVDASTPSKRRTQQADDNLLDKNPSWLCCSLTANRAETNAEKGYVDERAIRHMFKRIDSGANIRVITESCGS